MKKAGDILRGIIGEEQAAIAGKWSSFFSGWEKLVGTDIAAHSRVIDVKRGVVIVEVDHPGWLQVLHLKRAMTLTAMKQRYPSLGIKNMRIFVSDGKHAEQQDEHRPAGKEALDASAADASVATGIEGVGIDKKQDEESEEYLRFKAMLERLRKAKS